MSASPATPRLVLFDVDGTLVDSQNTIVEAQRRAFSAHGLPAPSRETCLSVVGLSLPEAFSVLAGPDGPIAGLAEAYRDAWGAIRATPEGFDPLYPGADDALRALRAAGFTLGIATGKSRRGIAHIVARHGWASLFATVQTADDGPSKPAPDMVLNAMRETGAVADETIMIGDTTFDILMARAAGVRAVAVDWGYHPLEAIKAAGPSAIVHSFADLTRLLGAGSAHVD